MDLRIVIIYFAGSKESDNRSQGGTRGGEPVDRGPSSKPRGAGEAGEVRKCSKSV